MWNKPFQEELSALPRPKATLPLEEPERIIRMHFYLGTRHWYVAAYEPASSMFFGYVVDDRELPRATWTYFRLDDLLRARANNGFEVDRSMSWRPCRASSVIRDATTSSARTGYEH